MASPRSASTWSSSAKISLLGLLYFVQGLPFGFQSKSLPIYLRANGVSLHSIGFLSLLSVPWAIKPLWAPLVDGVYSRKVGRRKSWLIPLHILLVCTSLWASFLATELKLTPFLGCIFLMNLFAATQDIAVDGLAIDLLDESDLGKGNAAQVAGFKVGMLVGGGLLSWASESFGWSFLFVLMASIIGAVLGLVIAFPENGSTLPETSAQASQGPIILRTVQSAARSVVDIVRMLWNVARVPSSALALLLISTYKLGESMIDAMFKPFLLDAGVDPATITMLTAILGMMFSILGSLLGGWLADRMEMLSLLHTAIFLRGFPLLLKSLLALSIDTSMGFLSIFSVQSYWLHFSIILENLAGGLLSTVIFAFMMSIVDKQIGATHFTMLAAVEIVGKSIGSLFSGVLAESFGYGMLFTLGTILSFAILPLIPAIRKQRKRRLSKEKKL